MDTVAWTVRHVPRWNPINVCSYHLQEAGATPVQELAYALATAIGVVDAVRDSGQLTADELPAVVGRISFFCNAGIRFVEEACKMRAFTAHVGPDLRGSAGGSPTRSCAGSVTASRSTPSDSPSSSRKTTCPASSSKPSASPCREAHGPGPSSSRRGTRPSGLPHPWDQQWSLRIQQILAYETDLLEYPDILDGSHVVEARTAELVAAAEAELEEILASAGRSKPSRR